MKLGQILAKVNADAYTSAVERTTAGVNVARTQAKASGNSIENAKQQLAQAKLQYENAKKCISAISNYIRMELFPK